MPTTLLEGLLSGLSHPAIGFDHLTFMVMLGLVAALMSSGVAVVAAFVAASLAGVAIHAANFDFTYSEQLVAASVILGGLLLITGRGSERLIWLPLSVVAGLIHGYAFGETVLGANLDVTAAYMLGVLTVVSAITVAVMMAVSKGSKISDAASIPVRAAGAIVASIGTYLLIALLHGD